MATEALFISDRTCCVCRERKPVQIHHIDGDPSNSQLLNLAVLCFECHHQTQTKGGFDRKLDASLVRRYREDWLASVADKRASVTSPSRLKKLKDPRGIHYTTLQESSEEDLYTFEASFIEIETSDPVADAETNLLINAAVLKRLQRFRAEARDRLRWKRSPNEYSNTPHQGFDLMQINHELVLFNEDLLSLRLETYQYNVGAAHGNDWTIALNFSLRPSLQLEPNLLFKGTSKYAETLSALCIPRIKELQRERFASWGGPAPDGALDDWIEQGASPVPANFKTLLLDKRGLRVVFDNYQVAPYAEGRYEVVIEKEALSDILTPGLYESLA